MGIGETFLRALAKLVIRAAGDQVKTSCGNLQLCAGLKSGIEGARHAVGQWRIEKFQVRRGEEEAEADASDGEEESGGMASRLNNLTIETAGT